MTLPFSLGPYETALVILAIEAALVMLSSHRLLVIAGSPREALKHPEFILQTLVFLVLIAATLAAGFALVSPLFVIGQAALAVVIGVLMIRFWARLNRALSEGPLSEVIWGGVLGIIGLVMVVGSVRPFNWEAALGGLAMGGLGFFVMISGLRKMWSGE